MPFPGPEAAEPEQQKIPRLKRKSPRKAERDIPAWRGDRHEVRLHCDAPEDAAGGDGYAGRSVPPGVLCLGDTAARSPQQER